MKKIGFAVLSAVMFFGFSGASFGGDLLPKDIMTKNFFVNRVKDSKSESSMTLINESGQKRERKSTGISKLQKNGIDNMRLIKFLSPADVKGTSNLMIEHSDGDDDIWIYLPALKKVRRLVSSNKGDSFVGSDFSYADVIGYKVQDFEHKITGSENVDGVDCYVIESFPVSDKVKQDNGLSKRKGWIRKDNFVIVKGENYDLSGQLYKVFKALDIQLVDKENNKWQPMTLEMTNVQVNHKTIVHFSNYIVNTGIDDGYFSQRNLERE
ncbi:MAG: outer membrane lipoprotein-sorting protein [Nitrospinae bacterium]|nr:outer membrane lipoprotein-sorting protein [Nitrospinota bacterium]